MSEPGRRRLSTLVISITPFDEDERFDAEAFRSHCRRMADGGVGTYVVGGGSGEETSGGAVAPLKIGTHMFRSRLLVGTGKYGTLELMRRPPYPGAYLAHFVIGGQVYPVR